MQCSNGTRITGSPWLGSLPHTSMGKPISASILNQSSKGLTTLATLQSCCKQCSSSNLKNYWLWIMVIYIISWKSQQYKDNINIWCAFALQMQLMASILYWILGVSISWSYELSIIGAEFTFVRWSWPWDTVQNLDCYELHLNSSSATDKHRSGSIWCAWLSWSARYRLAIPPWTCDGLHLACTICRIWPGKRSIMLYGNAWCYNKASHCTNQQTIFSPRSSALRYISGDVGEVIV